MGIVIAILTITMIDLVLSGDNAAVIGLAIRELPQERRKSAAFLGAAGAIILRVIFTAMATILIHIPYLYSIGGVILFWITWKLLQFNEDENDSVKKGIHFWDAIGSIIIADLSMAFDNILGVAGAAHGDIWLVIFGLALSIPILVVGSSWLANLMNRFPIFIYLGGAVLIHTALGMIFQDSALEIPRHIGVITVNLISWGTVLGVMVFGAFRTIPALGFAQHETAAHQEEINNPNQ